MATFRCNDIDGFVLDMEEYAKLPDHVITEILTAGAKVVEKAHRRAIGRCFSVQTGKLIGSPKTVLKRGSNGEQYALVYPDGQHHTYRAKKGKGLARNADVGFVHEFGGHGNAAKAWMLTANEESAEETTAAEAAVYDRWLESLNL